jgi:hypothetical protein
MEERILLPRQRGGRERGGPFDRHKGGIADGDRYAELVYPPRADGLPGFIFLDMIQRGRIRNEAGVKA